MANNLLAMSTADGWGTGIHMGEVVVVVSYGDGIVLPAVTVGVTNEGCLPVLVDC